MSHMRRLFAAALALLLPVTPTVASAQQGATITGRVTGEAQNPIANATVFIGALGVGTQTGSDGRYSLTVPAARVTDQSATIAVRAIGFKQATATITRAAATSRRTSRSSPTRCAWAKSSSPAPERPPRTRSSATR